MTTEFFITNKTSDIRDVLDRFTLELINTQNLLSNLNTMIVQQTNLQNFNFQTD